MKALSLLQPWASLIAEGKKEMETRNWATAYRGELAIHASKAVTPEESDAFYMLHMSAGMASLPHGAIIAVVKLDDCLRTESGWRAMLLSEQELGFGDFSDGRYAWLLSGVKRLAVPVPCSGRLGLWTVPVEVEAEVRQQLR